MFDKRLLILLSGTMILHKYFWDKLIQKDMSFKDRGSVPNSKVFFIIRVETKLQNTRPSLFESLCVYVYVYLCAHVHICMCVCVHFEALGGKWANKMLTGFIFLKIVFYGKLLKKFISPNYLIFFYRKTHLWFHFLKYFFHILNMKLLHFC